MKPRLIFFCDCPVLGGSDLLVVHLLKEPALRERFDPLIVYRDTPAFAAELRRRLPYEPAIPLRLFDRIETIARLEAARSPWLPLARVVLRLADAAYFPWLVLRLRSVFRRLEASVVHVNDGGYPGSLGCRAAAVGAALAGAKVLFAVHNQASRRRLPRDFAEPAIDGAVARSVERFVTASRVSQDALAARLPRAKMRLVPDGVPAPGPTAPAAEMRRALGIRSDEVAWCVTALFEARKGHGVLLDAVGRMKSAARFVLVGDGPERPRIESLAREKGLADRLLFLGYRTDSRDVTAACDGFCLPSVRDEDMPLAILDAMALGKPVVSTRLAAIPEEVADGETGLLAEPGDAAELAAALERLTTDPGLRARFGEAGRARFAERFELERMLRGYVSLYDELASKVVKSS